MYDFLKKSTQGTPNNFQTATTEKNWPKIITKTDEGRIQFIMSRKQLVRNILKTLRSYFLRQLLECVSSVVYSSLYQPLFQFFTRVDYSLPQMGKN